MTESSVWLTNCEMLRPWVVRGQPRTSCVPRKSFCWSAAIWTSGWPEPTLRLAEIEKPDPFSQVSGNAVIKLVILINMNMNSTTENSVGVTESQIGVAAYKLWESAGHPSGRDLEFWLNAEKQLRAASKAASSTPALPQSPVAADEKGVHKAASMQLVASQPNPAKPQQKPRRF